MNPMMAQYSDSLVRVLGHSLWQATVVCAVTWLVLRLLPARRSNWRYGIAVTGLATVVVLTFATWSWLQLDASEVAAPTGSDSPMAFDQSHGQDSIVAASIPVEQSIEQRSVSIATHAKLRHPLVIWLAGIWLAGATAMLVRGLVGQLTVQAWVRQPAIRLNVTPLELLIAELRRALGLRRHVRVMVSPRVSVPAIAGLLCPVLLVPPAMLTGIPLQQWQIVIAHELAHVVRWDAIVNLAQTVIESLLFFNPAVWWLSRQIRIEREACCDALAAHVCGQPILVARALVDVAATVVKESSPQPTGISPTMLAFADPAEGGELSDRVRRLVDPDKTPRVRVSWAGVGAVLIAIILVAIALQRGTDLAVRAAANWMSPKDRVNKLVQLEAKQNGNFIPPASVSPVQTGKDGTPTEGAAPAEKIPVHLIVRTDDGSEIGSRMNLMAMSHAGNSSSSSALGAPKDAGAEYRKTLEFSPCELRLAAYLPGRAAAVSPVVTLLPGDSEKTVELVLTRGANVDVLIQDESGKPIPQAWLQRSESITVRGGSSSFGSQEQQADPQGRLRLEHIGEADYSLAVQAPGYQRVQMKQHFRDPAEFTAESPFVITLKAARPTVVRVLDQATMQPVSKALVRLCHRQSATNGMTYGWSRGAITPNQWSDFGTTDETGRAVLDQLEEGTVYTFAIVAAGYGLKIIETRAGHSDQTILLSPPLTISGQVTGALDRLRKQTDPKKAGYMISIHVSQGERWNDSRWMDVQPDGTFTLDDLAVGDHLMVSLPDERRDYDLRGSLQDLKLQIAASPEVSNAPRRDVVIELTGTAEDAPARGSLYVSWQHPTLQVVDIQNGPLQVSENQIRLKALVGARLSVREHNLVGYRIQPQEQIVVGPGTEPLIIDVPTTPTGGIYGAILRADGSPAERAFVTIFATRLPRTEKDHRRINPSSSSGGSQYLRNVPLGGRYCVLAREESSAGYVWTLSEEVEIGDSNAIAKVDLRLPPGRNFKIKVTDEQQQPVIDQHVDLEVSFHDKATSAGLSFVLPGETDDTGVADFGHVSLDEPLGRIKLTATVSARPQKFRGKSMVISNGPPVVLQLKKGVTGSGVLIDIATNRPVPNADIRLIPRDFNEADFKGNVTTRTDAQGRFQFDGLEPIDYQGIVEGASPKGTVVTPVGRGLQFQYPQGVTQFILHAGPNPIPARWEAVLHPNSGLRPIE